MSYDPSVFAARRDAVLARMRERGGGVMLLPAASEKVRNADNEYPFRQDSDFVYLTGFDEPDGCALLFADPPPGRVEPGGERKTPLPGPGALVLFVRPRDREREIWTGLRAGVEGAKEIYGAELAFPAGEVEARLPALLEGEGPLWFRVGQDAAWDARVGCVLAYLRARSRTGVRAPAAIIDSGRVLHEMRLVKSPEEVARLRKAAEITAEAHLAAMRDGVPGRREYQVQAEIEYAFRRRGGSGPGYGTIVAAGANSCVLHYRAGDAVLREGDVCLVDAGGECDFYTADITRTFPVSGRFTPAQRKLYELCLEAQLEGVAAVRPGTTLDAIHDLTVRRLTEGLIRLGLLEGSADERIADKSYRKYYMHRTSHWLGMDVHDVGDYYFPDGSPRPLVPGMVLTIEPGLYVAAHDETAPPEMRGVGIRIEDDVLVTEGGGENLTAMVPKTIEEVEASCPR